MHIDCLVHFEHDAYYNVPLPKISAKIQRYGFQVEQERVLEFFLDNLKAMGLPLGKGQRTITDRMDLGHLISKMFLIRIS